MAEQFYPVTIPFSAGYELVENADVICYDEDEAVMGSSMFDALAERFGEHFLGYIDGLHYQFKREKAVPAGTAVVPEHNHRNPETLLIQL